MKTFATFIDDGKSKFGNPRMSDREYGERLAKFRDRPLPFSQQEVFRARSKSMAADSLAIAIALAAGVPPGEVLWIARTQRERDPMVRKHLDDWMKSVGKALASVSAKAVGALAALAVALSASLPDGNIGGAGVLHTSPSSLAFPGNFPMYPSPTHC